MESLEYGKEVNFFKIFTKAILISLISSFILIFILSFLVSKTNLKENIINPSVIFITSFSLIIGGFAVSKEIKKKGILYGAILGIVYMLLMYIISSFMNMNFSVTLNSLYMIIFGVLGGALGGILGVNMS